MKLFFKHLFRTVRKKPLQPILLVLILALAVATTVFSLSLDALLENETTRAQQERYGSADLTVTTDGASKSRFMFVRDAEAVFGDSAEVAGVLELPLSYGTQAEAVFGVATDFTEIGRIFDFTFTSHIPLTASAVPNAAFISSDFADRNGLACGDTFEVKVFGREKLYTVVGISPLPFLERYDILVDNSGVVPLLAGDSLLLSAVRDGFRPCSTLFIEILDDEEEDFSLWRWLFGRNEESDEPTPAQILAAAPAFASVSVNDVKGAVARANNTQALALLIDIAIVFTCALAAAVAFACLYILSTERTEENRSFMLSGARASHLHAAQYVEVLLYFAVGSVIGTLLSFPLVRTFVSRFEFRYAWGGVRATEVMWSVLFILLAAMVTVAIFTFSDPMMRGSKKEQWKARRLTLVPAAATVLGFVLMFLSPVRMRDIFALPLVAFFVVSICIYVPILMKGAAARIDRRMTARMERTHRAPLPALRYALKSIGSVKILRNTARLFALLSFVVLSVALLIMSSLGHMRLLENSFRADYIVYGATDNCYRGVGACETVESYHRVYFQTVETKSGKPLTALGAEDMAAFGKGLRPVAQPQGRYAAISSGEAKYSGLKIGDSLILKASGKEIEVVIGEILDSTLNAIVIDTEYFDLHYNLIFVDGKDAVTEAAVLSEISANTKEELATVMRVQTFWNERIDTIKVYLGAGVVLLAIICVFSMIAIVDNLLQSYRMRREEFSLYRLSGMSRGCVARMKAMEISLSLLFGFLMASVGAAVLLTATNEMFFSFAYDNMLGLKNFFALIP